MILKQCQCEVGGLTGWVLVCWWTKVKGAWGLLWKGNYITESVTILEIWKCRNPFQWAHLGVEELAFSEAVGCFSNCRVFVGAGFCNLCSYQPCFWHVIVDLETCLCGLWVMYKGWDTSEVSHLINFYICWLKKNQKFFIIVFPQEKLCK